jgi:hypothetical protein
VDADSSVTLGGFPLAIPTTVEKTNYILNVCLMEWAWHDYKFLDRIVFAFESSLENFCVARRGVARRSSGCHTSKPWPKTKSTSPLRSGRLFCQQPNRFHHRRWRRHNMTHQKLTTKFPTESVAKICRRWQRRYARKGIRPHPRQTRRKKAAETDSMMTARSGIPHNTGAGMVRSRPAASAFPPSDNALSAIVRSMTTASADLGRVLINAQIAAPLFAVLLGRLHGCPKNDTLRVIDERTL